MNNNNYKELNISELRKITQSTAPEAGRDPIIGHSIRFFSIYFTKLFLYTKITPLFVTVLSVLLFLFGVVVFVFNIFWLNLFGVFLVYVSIVLDGCNGELARLKKYRPYIGSIYIEPISHDIQYGLMFLPLSISAYLLSGNVLIIFAGFVATISKLLQRFFIMRYGHLVISEMKKIDTEGEFIIPFNPNVGFLHKMYRFADRNFFSSVGMVFPMLLAALFNRIDLFVWVFATVYTIFALLHFSKEIIHVIKIDKPENE